VVQCLLSKHKTLSSNPSIRETERNDRSLEGTANDTKSNASSNLDKA
jgi:hypothetical protein